MLPVVSSRIAGMLATLLLAAVLIFLITAVMPGDVASVIAGPDATPEQVEEWRERLGLGEPLIVQFGEYMLGLVRGDLGVSLITGEPVLEALARTYGRTLHLALAGLALAAVIGLALGMLAARHAGSRLDGGVRILTSILQAMPGFWLGLILVSIFALQLKWLPATGYVSPLEDPLASLRHMILPSLTLAALAMGGITRHTRSAVLDTMSADHLRTLRSVGISERSVAGRHTLKSASLPIITVIGLDLAHMIGGAVFIEVIFGINGVGQLMLTAAVSRDFPMVRGGVLVIVVVVVLMSTLTELAYAWADPRTRRQST